MGTLPETHDEYILLFHAHQRLSGRGFDTTVHMPCPFCAAADWNVYRVVDARDALAGERFCAGCKRTTLGTVTKIHDEVHYEMVLLEGDDPPAWMPMRRIGE
jgi:hypothetical protein